MKRQLWLALAAALVIVACSGDGRPTATDAPPGETLAPTIGPAPTTGMPADDPLSRMRQASVADLAGRLAVDPGQIELVAAEPVTWPDGSLGCPQPGVGYTQALVDGYRVILGHGGRVYVYHADGSAEPFLCESGERDGGHDFVPPPGFDE